LQCYTLLCWLKKKLIIGNGKEKINFDMIKLNIKPLSVNKAWQGRRYKTPAYKQYERAVVSMLPARQYTPPFSISIIFGFSSNLSDIDNPLKLILDIFQMKYKINDKDIFELNVKKELVPKGSEFIKFNIEKYTE
jgi:Holliday junction resolvase RusA-like endonuclease